GISFDNALFILILANAVAFAGYLFHGWVGDRLGRRNTVLVGFLLGGIASVIMLTGPSSSGFVIAMYAMTLFFLTGPFAAMLFYMGESYPAQVRGTGSNVAHVMAPVGAIVGSGLIAVMLGAGMSMMTA